ncbi:MAG TPA: thioesterase family protein [Chitinophagales bacterium]|nr:thioesterase family protein [Chitinophagales bacterium]
MKKERIEFPDTVLWSSKRVIEAEDINIAQHMGNERILVWADQIRQQFLNDIGWSEESTLTEFGLIVANHTIIYQSEGFLGDPIHIDVAVNELTEFSFDILIRCKKENATRNLVVMRTGMVCFNYLKREITPIPSQFLDKLEA